VPDSPRIILVPTPIGNLDDMTFRAINALKSCDKIFAEDTRTTGKLLQHFDIQTPIESFHQNNEHQKIKHVLNLLESGQTLCYCSDAGTPGISDPGYLLVRTAIENNFDVECLPGAAALIPAVVVSGLPSDRFVYEGFLPHKKGRMKRLEALTDEERTIVFYESPHRIVKLLNQMEEVFGPDRHVSVSKEISKLHETHYRGTITKVRTDIESKPIKGEFVVCLSGKS